MSASSSAAQPAAPPRRRPRSNLPANQDARRRKRGRQCPIGGHDGDLKRAGAFAPKLAARRESRRIARRRNATGTIQPHRGRAATPIDASRTSGTRRAISAAISAIDFVLAASMTSTGATNVSPVTERPMSTVVGRWRRVPAMSWWSWDWPRAPVPRPARAGAWRSRERPRTEAPRAGESRASCPR